MCSGRNVQRVSYNIVYGIIIAPGASNNGRTRRKYYHYYYYYFVILYVKRNVCLVNYSDEDLNDFDFFLFYYYCPFFARDDSERGEARRDFM